MQARIGVASRPGGAGTVIGRSPQHPDNSLRFEFSADGDSMIIRVDAPTVPAGAQRVSGNMGGRGIRRRVAGLAVVAFLAGMYGQGRA